MNRRRQETPASLRTAGVDAHHLGVLDEETCWRLLGQASIGRLGFSAGGLPVIFPLNCFLDHRTVVFRSEDGAKVRAAEQHAVACLEIDEFDSFAHSGWSVLATGRLEIASPDRLAHLAALPLTPWAISGAATFVELAVELLSGRVVQRG